MGNYLGKTNKELLIEVIGKVDSMQKQLNECRPVCFRSENEVIKLKEDYKNIKWVIAAIASFFTILLNLAVFIFKKFKGG